MRVRVAQNAPHSGARVIENIQGLPQVIFSDTSLKLERRRSDYRLSVLDAEPQSNVVSSLPDVLRFARLALCFPDAKAAFDDIRSHSHCRINDGKDLEGLLGLAV